MPPSERIFYFNAPKEPTGPGGDASGQTNPHQQSPLSEISLSPDVDQLVSALKHHSSALFAITAEGQTIASANNTKTIKAARREIWEETGGVPPIAGGSYDAVTGAEIPNNHIDQPQGTSTQPESVQPIQHGRSGFDTEAITETSLPSDKTEINSQYRACWRERGRGDFNWKRDLSENGQKLYGLFLRAVVDKELLPIIAAKQGFDLEAAIDELRSHNVIDDSDSKIFRLW
jgi:hypothetical protein